MMPSRGKLDAVCQWRTLADVHEALSNHLIMLKVVLRGGYLSLALTVR